MHIYNQDLCLITFNIYCLTKIESNNERGFNRHLHTVFQFFPYQERESHKDSRGRDNPTKILELAKIWLCKKSNDFKQRCGGRNTD